MQESFSLWQYDLEIEFQAENSQMLRFFYFYQNKIN